MTFHVQTKATAGGSFSLGENKTVRNFRFSCTLKRSAQTKKEAIEKSENAAREKINEKIKQRIGSFGGSNRASVASVTISLGSNILATNE